jgi:choline dehydrogenase-like flavoprotein
MAPYYRKAFNLASPTEEVRKFLALQESDGFLQGTAGPIQVSYGEGQGQLEKAWPETLRRLAGQYAGEGAPKSATGIYSSPVTVDRQSGTRSHAGSAYYSSDVARRPNLRLITNAPVDKIILGKSGRVVKATGVSFRTMDGRDRVANASREVILAAGTLMSPKILELSGIGSSKLLSSLGIKVLVNNPAVGENLQDHIVGCVSYEVQDGVPSGDAFRDPKVFEAVTELYASTKGGPMAASTFCTAFTEANGFLDSEGKAELKRLLADSLDDETSPATSGYYAQVNLLRQMLEKGDESSAQFFVGPFQFDADQGPSPREYLNPVRPGNYVSIFAALSHPFSRGSVHVESGDSAYHPAIDPRYLSHPLDRELLARHIQWIEVIARTEPWSALLKPNGRKIPESKNLEDLDAAREHLRLSTTNFHPVGTCAMMPRKAGGVVDERLRVYGTSNLRVVDASIIPLHVRGDIVSTVYAIAERASDFIKEDFGPEAQGRKSRRTSCTVM